MADFDANKLVCSVGILGKLGTQQNGALIFMCGRYVTPEEREIENYWHIGRKSWKNPFSGSRQARFNVAPQQGNPANYIPVIRADADGTLELTDMQWWLLPFWSKEPHIKYSTFNARVEGVTQSSSFKEAFKYRRCLIPARGWYEWQDLPEGKQPRASALALHICV